MPDSALIAASVGFAVGAALTLALIAAYRIAKSPRELGSESERAIYTTLDVAGLAAQALREDPGAGGRRRAVRHLRTMLGAKAVVLVVDGEAYSSAVRSANDKRGGDPDVVAQADEPIIAASLDLAHQVEQHGKRQVFTSRAEGRYREAVGVPIVIKDEHWGTLITFADSVRAPLVRATTGAAEWCAGQLAFNALQASRAALSEAELRALRAQISPHFIYNSLTAIASFISTNPPRARELVLEFADFTRYSFRRQGEFTTLAEELASIRSYLELEQARFGDRLRVKLQIAPETLTAVIPFLAMQPLVENAVRHGLQTGERGGTVRICSVDDGTHTEITVEDDGVGMDPATLERLFTDSDSTQHIGLRNVDTRLRQLYGERSGLVIETNPGAGTLVSMRVPRSQPMHEIGFASSANAAVEAKLAGGRPRSDAGEK